MADIGIRPFPMIYGERRKRLPLGAADVRIADKTLADFQRWAIRRFYTVVPFSEYDRARRYRIADRV